MMDEDLKSLNKTMRRAQGKPRPVTAGNSQMRGAGAKPPNPQRTQPRVRLPASGTGKTGPTAGRPTVGFKEARAARVAERQAEKYDNVGQQRQNGGVTPPANPGSGPFIPPAGNPQRGPGGVVGRPVPGDGSGGGRYRRGKIGSGPFIPGGGGAPGKSPLPVPGAPHGAPQRGGGRYRGGPAGPGPFIPPEAGGGRTGPIPSGPMNRGGGGTGDGVTGQPVPGTRPPRLPGSGPFVPGRERVPTRLPEETQDFPDQQLPQGGGGQGGQGGGQGGGQDGDLVEYGGGQQGGGAPEEYGGGQGFSGGGEAGGGERPPGAPQRPRLNPALGSIQGSPGGGGSTVTLNEAGKQAYRRLKADTKRRFGKYPGSERPDSPQPEIIPGTVNFNPFGTEGWVE